LRKILCGKVGFAVRGSILRDARKRAPQDEGFVLLHGLMVRSAATPRVSNHGDTISTMLHGDAVSKSIAAERL
jgi:hypothetical protein